MSTVLTIDDSRVVRSMVKRYLKPYGCEIVEAENGQLGVEAAKRHRPDLILLDVTMPVMDGRQALAELRKDPSLKPIPVIMLTAESGRAIVTEIAKLGVAGYILKPFKQDVFDKEVGKILDPTVADAAVSPDAGLDAGAVLVIDDSQRVLDAASAAIGDSLKVLTAISGADGVERYRETRPGVVVVDLAMPDMDGFATMAEIQKLGPSLCLALVLRGDDAAHDRALSAGYAAVVEKPFQGGELLDEVIAASSRVIPPAELARKYMSEDGGLPVIALPGNAGRKTFSMVMPALVKTVRGLAEDGADRLIVDLTEFDDVSGDFVTQLVRLLREATSLGIRTAFCVRAEGVANKLAQFAETKGTPHGFSRDAARECLQ